jgi:hypothetical protein
MRRFALLPVLTLVSTLSASSAFATSYQVVMTGSVDKQLAFSFFGSFDQILPLSLSFVIDDAAPTTVTAGTDITGFLDYSDADYHLFSASSVSALTVTVGNATFTTADLFPRPLGATSNTYAVLVSDDLSNPNARVSVNVLNGFGYLFVNQLACSGGECTVPDSGEAYSNEASDFGYIFDVQTSITAIPEPATALFTMMGLLGLAVRRKRRA